MQLLCGCRRLTYTPKLPGIFCGSEGASMGTGERLALGATCEDRGTLARQEPAQIPREL